LLPRSLTESAVEGVFDAPVVDIFRIQKLDLFGYLMEMGVQDQITRTTTTNDINCKR
jgi:hypothetical protein